MLVTGISGAEFGIRGFIDGWDPETGKHLWRRYTIPARGEKGNETWPQNNNAWEVGGGSTWITGSYDPELDLMYWGIGNPAPWASQTRDGDNLYTSSVLAMRPKTGEIVWHYQFTPNDPYDYDACWELINADINVGGAEAQGDHAAQPQRLPLRARPHQRQAARRQSVREGQLGERHRHGDRPAGRDRGRQDICAGEQIEHWPSTRGGKNWPHAAFNPDTGLLYANTMHVGRMYKHLETKPHVVGQRYMYIENLADPAEAGRARRPHGGDRSAHRREEVAHAAAPIYRSGRRCSRPAADCCSPARRPASSSRSTPTPARSCGSSRPAPASTPCRSPTRNKGRQYVTVLSGIGGLYWNIAREQLKDKVPQGGSVWTFALMED